jgi:hypothetical protein
MRLFIVCATLFTSTGKPILSPVEVQGIMDEATDEPPSPTLSLYLTKLVRLGGYLARAKDSHHNALVQSAVRAAAPVAGYE